MILKKGVVMKKSIAFIAGVADDKGFGFSIAQSLANKHIPVVIGVWPPMMNIFLKSLERGQYDHMMTRNDGSKWEFEDIIPFEAGYDTMEDIPSEISASKRYIQHRDYTISESATKLALKYNIKYVVHSIGNAPEIKNSLLNTSRKGYLEAISLSSYSFVSIVRFFSPVMEKKGSFINLTFRASTQIIPGYGGGMSSAKAALESDTKTLAYEVGRKYGHRVNTISAGPLGSRAAKAIGFIDKMIDYSIKNAPLQKELHASEVANTCAFLLSDEASAITGTLIYVDNGLHAMGFCSDVD